METFTRRGKESNPQQDTMTGATSLSHGLRMFVLLDGCDDD
jgi:hypothetical protein